MLLLDMGGNMMKKTYESPEMEVSIFSLKNVLTSSFIEEPSVPEVTDYSEPDQPDAPRV